MSGIYRRSSSSAGASAATRSVDPDNLTLWRMNARRMEAEVVRDALLFVTQQLDQKLDGPSSPVTENSEGKAVLGAEAKRRSTFVQVQRRLPLKNPAILARA